MLPNWNIVIPSLACMEHICDLKLLAWNMFVKPVRINVWYGICFNEMLSIWIVDILAFKQVLEVEINMFQYLTIFVTS